ncbi:MAG: NYN domain-containing protein [Actinomycetes bacterium]
MAEMVRLLAPNQESDRSSDDYRQISRARVLSRAIESAVVQAKRDASDRKKGAPLPPAALRPLLNFVRLPSAASRTVIEVLDSDEGFRDRVAGNLSEEDLGRGSWLFLRRPTGWFDELELLIAASAEEEAELTAGVQGRSAERRLSQAEEAVTRLKAELADSQAAALTATEALAAERAAALGVKAKEQELLQQVEVLEQQRQQAVRSMKDAEKRAATRLDEARAAAARADLAEQHTAALEARSDQAPSEQGAPSDQGAASEQRARSEQGAEQASSASVRPPLLAARSHWDEIDPTKIQAALSLAAEAAASLGQQLAALAQTVSPAAAQAEQARAAGIVRTLREQDESFAPNSTAPEPNQRPPRRTPIHLVRGVIDGSPEGVEQLLVTPQVIVILDGYNISMEAWPLLNGAAQRSSLLDMLTALQARTAAIMHVVFDGEGAGDRPAVGAPLAVRVHFSPADVEADDVILEMVASLPTDQGVIVVSSDRRVQDGARRLGANVVKSSQLLAVARNS